MKSCIKVFLLVSLFVVVLSAPASNTTYDQRQQGKYNIHLNIKDVAIITFDSDTISGELGVGIIFIIFFSNLLIYSEEMIKTL